MAGMILTARWRPFACHGDSGSAIVHGDKLIGILIAGEDVLCPDVRNSYFQSWDVVERSITDDADAEQVSFHADFSTPSEDS